MLAKLTALHRQVLISLAIAAIAGAILMRTSAERMPSLRRVAHGYLELVTSSDFWPFMLISALGFSQISAKRLKYRDKRGSKRQFKLETNCRIADLISPTHER